MSVNAQTTSRKGRPASGKTVARPALDPRQTVPAFTSGQGSLLEKYQQQICELEATVTRLRGRVHGLSTALVTETQSRTHFQRLFEQAPAAYFVHDRSGGIHQMNRKAARLLGVRQAESTTLAQFISKEDLVLWLNHTQRILHQGHACTELRLQSRTGKLVPVQMDTEAVLQPLGRAPTLFRTSVTDVGPRAAAEAALVQAQTSYQRLIDTVEGIVWEADADSLQIRFVSRYAERLLGYPVQDWLRPGFWLDRLYVEDRERVANQVARLVAGGENLVTEYRVMTADSRILWLHDNATKLERDGGLRLLGVAFDVTERHRAEEALLRNAEQLEQRVVERTARMQETVADLEAFSYSLSHDMRSPIRAMQGYAALLEQKAADKLGPDSVDYLRRIMKSAQRLDMLVQ
ncbi:MAG: PAS domain-containing sensor histidine kinase, partial [Limisphaerales bacterium]